MLQLIEPSISVRSLIFTVRVPPQTQRRIVASTMMALAALAFPTLAISTRVAADPFFQVAVLSNSPDVLATVRTKVPDAYIATAPDGKEAIVAGTFSKEENAREQAAILNALNVSSTIKSYEPEATETIAEASENSGSITTASDSTSNTAKSPEPTATASQPSPTQTSDRRYTTLASIPPETPPEEALQKLQHYFPQASLRSRAGEPSIQTGSFSSRSQAQLQADWLAEQGWTAIAAPTDDSATQSADPQTVAPLAAAPQPPQAPAPQAAAPIAAYWVLIADPIGQNYPAVKAIVPEAQPTLYNQQQVVRTGAYSTEAEALDQVRFLASKGYEAGVFSATEDSNPQAAQSNSGPI